MTAKEIIWYQKLGLCETFDILFDWPYKFKVPRYIKQ